MKADGKKLAIFDFCDTLAIGQTASPFLSLVLKRTKRTWFLWEFCRVILRKLRILEGERHKKFQVRSLKGVDAQQVYAVAEEYESKYLKYHEKIRNKIQSHLNSGDHVVIVSGGFSEYIDVFARYFEGHVTVVANSLELKGNSSTGKLATQDCMGINKVELMSEVVALEKYDLNRSFVYTDHASDLPLMLLVGNRYFLSSTSKPRWASLYSVNVIHYD